jgi:hypothetical protein
MRQIGLASVELFLRSRQRRVDSSVDIGLDRSSGNLRFIDLDGLLHLLLHAVEIERLVARDAFGHLADEPFGDVALLDEPLGVVLDQQIQNR